MIDNSLVNIKLKMLNTFEEYVCLFFKKFEDNQLNVNDFRQHLKQYFESWNFARVDIKNVNNDSNNIKLKDESSYNVIYPKWLNDKNGHGCVIQSVDNVHLEIECIGSGELSIQLRSKDFKNLNHERIPIYVNCIKSTINNSVIFENNNLVSVDNLYTFSYPCRDNEKLGLDLEFETVYDYFPNLKNICNMLNDENDDLKSFFNFLKEYISFERSNLNQNDNELKKLVEENHNLSEKLNSLSNEFSNFKEYNNNVLDSYNTLFDSLFKFHSLEPTPLVKYSRELTMNLLDFIDKVCKKYDLQWWLIGGSLLGSVRHEGFIPWDDDLDIGMLRKDYEQFLRIIDQEAQLHNLDEYAKFITNSRNNTYHFIKMEYRINGRLFSFIDIYPFDFVSEPPKNFKETYEKEYLHLHGELKKGKNRLDALENSFKKLNVSKQKTDTLMTGIERNYFRLYDYDSIFPLKQNRFEDRQYYCPNDSKKCLEIFFGEGIMDIPKIVDQHGFYDMLLSFDNALEILKEHSLLIKNINNDFK